MSSTCVCVLMYAYLSSLFAFLQVHDSDLEPMLGPSEAAPMLTYYVDKLGREFGNVDDGSTNFWGRVDGDYEGP